MRYFLALTILIGTLTAQAQNRPLKFQKTKIDLGTIQKGQKISESFQYTNVSNESVFIDLVSTCECTEANWTSEEIKPGDSGEINFVFDTNKKEDAEPIDVDVILRNTDAKGNPHFYYLQYTFSFE